MEGSETVMEKISDALETWLDGIIDLEERQFRLNSLQERVNRTIQQIQFEGMLSIYDVEHLRTIGKIWINILNLLKGDGGDERKRLLIVNLLQLY